MIDWKNLLGDWAPAPILRAPAAPESVSDLESRIGRRLPPSYREFLCRSDGWESGDGLFVFFPAERICPFGESAPTVVELWTDSLGVDIPVPDQLYLRYGANQDPMQLRPAYMAGALHIGQGVEMDFLLVPDVLSEGKEWEAWCLSSIFPGARRYPSFLDMMSACPVSVASEASPTLDLLR